MDYQTKLIDKKDLRRMEKQMRPMDRFEFDLMSGGWSMRDCLEDLDRRTLVAKAAYLDGKLLAIGGVVPAMSALSTVGSPWLCATPLVETREGRRAFIQHSRSEFELVSFPFRLLWNVCSEKNVIAIRWLKWLGFEFDGSNIEIDGNRFLKFKMER
ncbi:hypothetical protein [uncultured Cohaesibacter sp.]|uniref:hypothetical protein n=1 Tax=uncultured Cohaesibacter sp. TaxID=1002546 RepID=UPI0029308600|nr:hypothetical protein [uncultured Cohaesibacter sp.]